MSRIVCVVDNEAQAPLMEEHGLSFWLEIGERVVLFDTGQTPAVLRHNLDALGLDLSHPDALALSHAHYDHTGGLDAVLRANPGMPLFALNDLFRPRYAMRNGVPFEIGLKIPPQELAARCDLRLSDEPAEILPGLWTTGAVSERPEAVGGSEHLVIQTEQGWAPDPYRDDMSLVFRTSKGLTLICGCCHAGLLNTLAHVEKRFGDKVSAVFGGAHLVSAGADQMAHTVMVFRERYPETAFHLNHCTGREALGTLQAALGGRVRAFPAGSTTALVR